MKALDDKIRRTSKQMRGMINEVEEAIP